MRVEAAITLVSAALAGVFIYYSKPISRKLVTWMNGRAAVSATNRGPVIAIVENASGSAVIHRLTDQSDITYRARAQSPIYHLDQILLARASAADLSFPSGYRLRLLPGTEATIQSYRPNEAGSPVLITLSSGDFQILARGTEGLLYIAMNNQIFAPEFRPKSAPATPPLASMTLTAPTRASAQPSVAVSAAATAPSSAPDKLLVGGRETLSNEYIEKVIRTHAAAFQHCQMNSIRDNLASEGSLLFNMTISPAGQVAHLHILQDMLNNKELLECTRSVLERLQFESFNGDPMTINYPIDYK